MNNNYFLLNMGQDNYMFSKGCLFSPSFHLHLQLGGGTHIQSITYIQENHNIPLFRIPHESPNPQMMPEFLHKLLVWGSGVCSRGVLENS